MESDFFEKSGIPHSRASKADDLAEALATLDPSDQARIFVPLDLVQKMLSAKS